MKVVQATPAPEGRVYLRPDELAKRWGVSTKLLSNWRCEGRGPKFTKLGSIVRYALDDVETFEQAGERS